MLPTEDEAKKAFVNLARFVIENNLNGLQAKFDALSGPNTRPTISCIMSPIQIEVRQRQKRLDNQVQQLVVDIESEMSKQKDESNRIRRLCSDLALTKGVQSYTIGILIEHEIIREASTTPASLDPSVELSDEDLQLFTKFAATGNLS